MDLGKAVGCGFQEKEASILVGVFMYLFNVIHFQLTDGFEKGLNCQTVLVCPRSWILACDFVFQIVLHLFNTNPDLLHLV